MVMADVYRPKGLESFEEELNALGLPDEIKRKLLETDQDLLAGIRKCRHMADLLRVMVSIEPNVPMLELEGRYGHFWKYVNAKARGRQKEAKKTQSVIAFTRDHVNRTLEKKELPDKPSALMAFKVADLNESSVSLKDKAGDVIREKKSQIDWIVEHETKGFQLIFSLQGKIWTLFDNTTGYPDEIVLRHLPQEQLNDFWLGLHPVKRRRDALAEKFDGKTIH